MNQEYTYLPVNVEICPNCGHNFNEHPASGFIGDMNNPFKMQTVHFCHPENIEAYSIKQLVAAANNAYGEKMSYIQSICKHSKTTMYGNRPDVGEVYCDNCGKCLE